MKMINSNECERRVTMRKSDYQNEWEDITGRESIISEYVAESGDMYVTLNYEYVKWLEQKDLIPM